MELFDKQVLRKFFVYTYYYRGTVSRNFRKREKPNDIFSPVTTCKQSSRLVLKWFISELKLLIYIVFGQG